MKNIALKRERDKRMVSQMIALYCRKKHHTRGEAPPSREPRFPHRDWP